MRFAGPRVSDSPATEKRSTGPLPQPSGALGHFGSKGGPLEWRIPILAAADESLRPTFEAPALAAAAEVSRPTIQPPGPFPTPWPMVAARNFGHFTGQVLQ